MSMLKKDFIALADELRYEKVTLGVLHALCRFMNRQNPNFNEKRWKAYFRGECGPSGGTVKKSL